MITEGAGPSAVHTYRLCGPNAHDGMNSAKLVYLLTSECSKYGTSAKPKCLLLFMVPKFIAL